MQLGILYPGLTGDLVVVSSAPFLPALSMGLDISADSSRRIGQMIQQSMVAQDSNQVRSSQEMMLAMMMHDSIKRQQVIRMAIASDGPTQAQVMYELFTGDLRPRVSAIQSRVLVLGDWIAYRQYGATRENVYYNLSTQLKPVKQLKIALSDTAKHFIMFDDPKWFFQQTDDFLQAGR